MCVSVTKSPNIFEPSVSIIDEVILDDVKLVTFKLETEIVVAVRVPTSILSANASVSTPPSFIDIVNAEEPS